MVIFQMAPSFLPGKQNRPSDFANFYMENNSGSALAPTPIRSNNVKVILIDIHVFTIYINISAINICNIYIHRLVEP